MEFLDQVWEPCTPTMQGHDGAEPPIDLEIRDIAGRVVDDLPDDGTPLYLAGHSFGGSVCLELALSFRLSISGIVLFEPVPLDFLRLAGKADMYTNSYNFFLSYCDDFDGGNKLAVRGMIDYWFGDHAFEAMPEVVRNYLTATTATNVRDVKCGLRRRYELEDLARLPMPLHIVYGDAGPDITRQIAESIAACVPNGEAKVLAGGNHAMLAEHPESVARFINQMTA